MSDGLAAEGVSSQGSLPSADLFNQQCVAIALLGNICFPDLLINIIPFGERMEATHINDAC